MELIRASKKRFILAFYIDFMIVTSILGLVYSAFESHPHKIVILIVFAIYEAAFFYLYNSPGKMIISIDDNGYVNPMIYKSENLFTIALGVFSLNSAFKNLIRWAFYENPMPFFGTLFRGIPGITLHILLGCLLFISGILILKLYKNGFFFAITVAIITAISTFMSRGLFFKYAKIVVPAKSAYMGVPISPGEIVNTASMMLPISIMLTMSMITILILNRKKFSR